MVAREMGRMVMTAVATRPQSTLPELKRPKTVFSKCTGRPTQAAVFTAEKSTFPVRAATR